MAMFSVFLTVEPQVQFHIISALSALLITPFVLWRSTRDRLHKVLGYAWVTAMACTALSSFLISGVGGLFGGFSLLHGLAIFTLYSLFITVRAAIRRDIATHKAGLRNVATFGLGLPAVFTFLPGRTMTRAFVPGNDFSGLLIIAALFCAIVLWRLIRRDDKPLRRLTQGKLFAK